MRSRSPALPAHSHTEPLTPHLRHPVQATTPERPVIVHRAILGSVERMFAILTEHYAGKWPFWLNPRQVRKTSSLQVFMSLQWSRQR